MELWGFPPLGMGWNAHWLSGWLFARKKTITRFPSPCGSNNTKQINGFKVVVYDILLFSSEEFLRSIECLGLYFLVVELTQLITIRGKSILLFCGFKEETGE